MPKNQEKIKGDSTHNGHRERMRERFLQTEFDGFEEHQILEMLLYYVYPRNDTNPMAHKLLDKIGTISDVLDSPIDVLMDAGLTKNGATFLSMLPHISRIYLDDKNNNRNKIIDFSNLGEYFAHKFVGRKEENLILLLADAKGKEIFCGVVATGSFYASEAPLRRIVDLALRYNAATAVIAHNHPSGVAMPSKGDIKATTDVANALSYVGVKLIDHIIVADCDYISLYETALCDDLITVD